MEEFIKKLYDYVNMNVDIDVCLLMGSHADKRQKRCDEYSDIDLFIITEKNVEYLKNYKWMEFYKKVSLHFLDPISLGIGMELRVCFEDELLADVAIVNFKEFESLMNNEIFRTKIIGRGFEIVKSNYPQSIYQTSNLVVGNECTITEESLNRLRDEFIIDIYNILKYFYRGDYFTSFYAFERRISKIIVYILEESYKLYSIDKDVMFNGRYMEKWLTSEDYEYVRKIFLDINKDNFLESIRNSIILFENKCQLIANKLNISLENKENSIEKVKRKINNGRKSL